MRRWIYSVKRPGYHDGVYHSSFRYQPGLRVNIFSALHHVFFLLSIKFMILVAFFPIIFRCLNSMSFLSIALSTAETTFEVVTVLLNPAGRRIKHVLVLQSVLTPWFFSPCRRTLWRGYHEIIKQRPSPPQVPPDRDSDKDRQGKRKKEEKQEITCRAPEQHKRWGRREARYCMTNGQNVFLSCHNISSAVQQPAAQRRNISATMPRTQDTKIQGKRRNGRL